MNLKSVEKYWNDANGYLKTPVAQVIIALLLAYILMPDYLSSSVYLCEQPETTVGGCLDQSWNFSINLALRNGLTFGKDYVFTYGALGFLSTRNAFDFNPRYFIFFDLFIVLNLVYILLYAIRRHCNLLTVCLCFLTAYTVASGSMYMDQIVFVLLIISIFWLNHALENLRLSSLVVSVIVTTILFYIKVNISFIGLAIFYAYLIYFIISDKKNFWGKIACAGAVPCLIFLLSFPLNTNIIGYVRGGLSLIEGYNDAMGIKLGDYQKYFVRALIMGALFFAFFLFRNFKSNLVLMLTGLLASFVLYKQSFVRADLHITAFFAIFPGICGVLLIFYKKVSPSQFLAAIIICIVCLSVGLSLEMYPSLKDRANYIADIASPPDLSERYKNSFERFKIPEQARQAIGDGSVDIIPWNIDYVYFNNFKYNPRPVIQSYSAYTPYLMDVNGQKYESDSAPDFVIVSTQSIDNRYGFFDDEKAKLALIENYSCIGYFYPDQPGTFLLFKKNPHNKTIVYSDPVKKMIGFSEKFNLEDENKSYFIRFDIDYTIFGKAMQSLYKPPQIFINFDLQDGTARKQRAIVPILNGGVLINPLIEEEKDFYRFATAMPLPEAKKIKSFSLELDSPPGIKQSIYEAVYKKAINLSVSEISIVQNN